MDHVIAGVYFLSASVVVPHYGATRCWFYLPFKDSIYRSHIFTAIDLGDVSFSEIRNLVF